MARSKNEDGELTIMDLVHDPIITCPHPPLALAAHRLNCGRRPWIDGQQLPSRLDAPARRRVQLAELPLHRARLGGAVAPKYRTAVYKADVTRVCLIPWSA